MVSNSRFKIAPKGDGRKITLRNCVIISFLVFTQNFIVTVETVKIAQLHAWQAGFWDILSATCLISTAIIIINDKRRGWLIPFYVLASAAATVLGVFFGATGL